MNDQLSKQAGDIRSQLESEGFQVLAEPSAGNLIEAAIPTGRGNWTVRVALERPSSGDLISTSLWRDGDKFYEMALNPAEPAEESVARLKQAFSFSVVNDPNASNEDVEDAVALVREVIPSNTVGYMGDKSPIAVLAEAVLRLTGRVKELEAKTP